MIKNIALLISYMHTFSAINRNITLEKKNILILETINSKN